MFKRLIRADQKSPASPLDSHQIHGFVYCAALNVHRLARCASTPADVDHLVAALANLQRLAQAANSPAADQSDLAQWRATLQAKSADLRNSASIAADTAPLGPIQIDTTVLADQLRRRVPA